LRKRDIPKYIKLFHDIIINKRTGPFLVELINQETKQIVIAEVFCSLILENDKIKGIQAVSRDITDKKKVLEDLKNSEEKYRSIVEMSPSAICTIDLKGYMVSCNKSFTQLTGLSKKEIVGKHFTKFTVLSKKEIPRYIKLFSQVLRGKVPDPFETKWYHVDGRERIGMVYCTIMEKNAKKSLIQVIAVDLTQSKLIEKEIREKKEELELLNKINNGINTGKDIDKIIEMISDETGKLFNSHKASVFLLSEDKKYLIMKKSGISEKNKKLIEKTTGIDLSTFKIPLFEGSMYLEIIKDIRPRLLNDGDDIIRLSQNTTNNQFLKKIAYFAQKTLKNNSVMVVPLFSKDECFGILDISSEFSFTEEDLQRFANIAEQLSVALKKIQVESKLKTAHENLKKLNEELEEKVKERTAEIQRILHSKDEFINQLGHDLKNPLNPLINLIPVLQEGEMDKKRIEIFVFLRFFP
jgi:PAS domain S-box-containing protein